jgi:hypothetical protein
MDMINRKKSEMLDLNLLAKRKQGRKFWIIFKLSEDYEASDHHKINNYAKKIEAKMLFIGYDSFKTKILF